MYSGYLCIMEKLHWHTEQRKVSELIPYEKNPRFLSPSQKVSLIESLRKFGLAEIPAIDLDNRIVAGHQRIKLLIEQGKGDDVIDVRVPNRKLTDEEFREYLIRSNANTGSWDTDMLGEHFATPELNGWGLDIEQLLPNPSRRKPKETHLLPKVKASTPISTGDIFQLGSHRIICGDSTNPDVYKVLLGDAKVQMVFTSPPYNMNKGMYETYRDNRSSSEYVSFNLRVVENIKPYLSGFLFWNISYNSNARFEFLEIAYKLATETGLRFMELIVWDKKKGMPITSEQMLTRQYEDVFVLATDDAIADIEIFLVGNTKKTAIFHKKTARVLTNLWVINPEGSQLENHKACYPVELPIKGIELTTVQGNAVFDPFLGTGTTLMAAEQTDRACYGVELDPLYVQLIIERWHNYHQQQQKPTPFKHMNGELNLQELCKK